ncbi:MAG: peptide chain release factor N(5)-glutamine methyltransferase [Nitrospinales bacterium]
MMQWTAENLLKWSIGCLTKAGVEQPRPDSELLVAETLGCAGRHAIYLEPDRPVSASELAECRGAVERRAAREPVHYILGRREFWSLDFKVNPHVLIPRPETEILVEHVLKRLSAGPRKPAPKILDLGVGAGNIAVAVAREIPDSHVAAVDVSENALAVARQNAGTHQVAGQIRFLRGHLFESVRTTNLAPFDCIVSNPPYIDTATLERLMPEVKDFEPRLALDGGSNGLEVYENIIPQAGRFLNPRGWLILEIECGQADAILQLVEKTADFEPPEVHPDYSGYPRVVAARKKAHG